MPQARFAQVALWIPFYGDDLTSGDRKAIVRAAGLHRPTFSVRPATLTVSQHTSIGTTAWHFKHTSYVPATFASMTVHQRSQQPRS
ncbi:hypothetical protein PHBOTO_001144 [Pseudozyma hubeiensis]|nr:hypothetical protein PHBOTO_001144 [Pseudozyma hubeiensis]